MLDGLVDLTLILAACSHVLLAPSTKVEESFSIQAIHDVLTYGISPSSLVKYDHNAFPGAVPRSFIGPILFSIATYPLLLLLKTLNLVKSSADVALFLRVFLAILYASSLVFFSYQTFDRSKQQIIQRRSFLFICMIQFHPLFWAGRTTPNGIVSPLVIVALSLIFSKGHSGRSGKFHAGLALLTASQVIARMELVGTVLPVAICGLFSSRVGRSYLRRFGRIAVTGILAASFSIVLSIVIDTYFWNRPFTLWNPLRPPTTQSRGLLWPELEAILFNVVEGKSSEWGISPWHTYLTSHLPKLLSFTTPLCLLGVGIELWSPSSRLSMLVVAGFHVFLLSQLGHKETRFVSYLVPLLNTFAARATSALWNPTPRSRSVFSLCCKAVVICLTAATVLVSFVSLRASVGNYPGGEALQALHTLVHQDKVNIHIDVLPAMTGVNLFQSIHLPRGDSALGVPYLPSVTSLTQGKDGLQWTYDKSEGLSKSNEDDWKRFTHLVSEDQSCHVPSQFELLSPTAFVEFDGLSRRRPKEWLSMLLHAPTHCLQTGIFRWSCLNALLPLEFRWKESVWLCQRRQPSL